MEITKQLAVFLDNRPGTLSRVCAALAEAKVNIHALTTSDTIDHSVVRMVVDDPQTAVWLLEERGAMVVEDEVLLVEAAAHELEPVAQAAAPADLPLQRDAHVLGLVRELYGR